MCVPVCGICERRLLLQLRWHSGPDLLLLLLLRLFLVVPAAYV